MFKVFFEFELWYQCIWLVLSLELSLRDSDQFLPTNTQYQISEMELACQMLGGYIQPTCSSGCGNPLLGCWSFQHHLEQLGKGSKWREEISQQFDGHQLRFQYKCFESVGQEHQSIHGAYWFERQHFQILGSLFQQGQRLYVAANILQLIVNWWLLV